MKKYAVSKETFDYITQLLAEQPNHLLSAWELWLNGVNCGSDEYEAIKELNKVGVTASLVITELLQGKAELEVNEKKYRLYHKQNSGVMTFAYHYFTKSGTLQDSDDFDDISILTEKTINEIAKEQNIPWLWEWAYEVKDND